MGKKKSIAIYARDVVFENNEESFIKMCYMMNNKITDREFELYSTIY